MKIRQHSPPPLSSCPYLPHRLASIEHAEILSLLPGEYQRLLGRRWFKFGQHLQRPQCRGCRLCSSMRVPLPEWRLSRTQRRVLRMNADLEVRVTSPPVLTEERLALLNRYREAQHARRSWGNAPYTAAEFAGTFVEGCLPMTEISVWQDGTLVAALMADIDPPNISAVTHFYDPGQPGRSLGIFTILQAFLHGAALGLDWMYLGYFVPGSPSMAYKSQFRPHELQTWHGNWIRAGEA